MGVSALEKLGRLPGMFEVKKQVEQIIQFNRVSKLRERHGLRNDQQSMHLVFTGNPGTGKTTAARLIGEAFASMGLLKSDEKREGHVPFVEIHQADITSKFVGDSEKNIVNKFKKARGGVIFIDEAYSFIGGDSKHKTDEKIVATIVQLMEDLRDEVMVIAAGYAKEMDEFLDSNPGLRSRFSNTVDFPNYSVPDMMAIAQSMFGEREYVANKEYLSKLADRLHIEKDKKGFGNARTVRNIVEQSIRIQSVRLSRMSNPSREDLLTVTVLDIEMPSVAKRVGEKEALQKAMAEIQGRLLEIELREIVAGKVQPN
jgi:stage V sporulation protein K